MFSGCTHIHYKHPVDCSVHCLDVGHNEYLLQFLVMIWLMGEESAVEIRKGTRLMERKRSKNWDVRMLQRSPPHILKSQRIMTRVVFKRMDANQDLRNLQETERGGRANQCMTMTKSASPRMWHLKLGWENQCPGHGDEKHEDIYLISRCPWSRPQGSPVLQDSQVAVRVGSWWNAQRRNEAYRRSAFEWQHSGMDLGIGDAWAMGKKCDTWPEGGGVQIMRKSGLLEVTDRHRDNRQDGD